MRLQEGNISGLEGQSPAFLGAKFVFCWAKQGRLSGKELFYFCLDAIFDNKCLQLKGKEANFVH